MTKKQKRVLYRILASAVLTVLLHFIPVTGLQKFILFLIPYLIIGCDVLKKAALGIFHGEIFDENFLMAIATVGAFALGSYGEGVEVMLFYQIGELFQSYAVGKSRRNIASLMDIRPDYANIERGGQLVSVDPEEIAIGDVIVIRPGERVPLDGFILEGSSSLNTSALTGESIPRQVMPGDSIISGCVNESGLLRVSVSKPFGESTVAKILELVENSSLRKSKAENFITKFARYYTPAVCIGAVLLAILPPIFLGCWVEWFRRALTFLVISCPCALVISIPLSFFGGIGGASRAGILVKGGNYLEALASAKTVVFDKTGTLTQGTFRVTEIFPEAGFTAEELLTVAALAESYSVHPISKSLREALTVPVNPQEVYEVEEIAGHGVKANIKGKTVAVGNANLMEKMQISYLVNTAPGTIVYVAIDDHYAGSIVISDTVKANSQKAVSELNAKKIHTVMLTGDSASSAFDVAAQLGIQTVYSQLLPNDKVEKVEQLLSDKPSGSSLVFVGDGINDAPVLSRADIGVAMGALGSDAAIEAADIVLMDDDPAKLTLAMKISRKCLAIVKQNIIFALGVKALCLLLGAFGHADMQAAIFADVGVMILAVLNAMRTLNTKTSG